MAGFRDKIIHGISGGVGFIPPGLLQKLSNQRLILPFYHAVSDNDMPHIKHLYTVKGVKAFIDDLDFLLKYYEPIDYSQFRVLTQEKRPPEKPSFLLSFDDGLREFHDVIAPILLEKGIPAICFLNSGFIDNKDIFYRYKSSLLVDFIKRDSITLDEIANLFRDSTSIIQEILSVNYQNKDLLDEIAKRLSFNFNSFLTEHSPYLSSKQIRNLISQGFHFGAHSIDHPEYQYLELEEQIRQTKESMQYIYDKYALDYKLFSFPFTDYNISKKFFSHINAEQIVDYTFGSAGQKKDENPDNYQRIPFEMANISGRKIHNAELFYYLLKVPVGKNLIKRI